MDTGLETSLRSGLAYVVATGNQDVLITAARLRTVLTNPAGSKRNLLLKKIIVETNAPAMTFARLVVNPTQSVGAADIMPTNLNLDPNVQQPPVARVRTDTVNTALTDAAGNNGTEFGVPAAARTVYDDVPFLIPPGTTIGFDVRYLNLLAAIKCELIAVFIEEKIA